MKKLLGIVVLGLLLSSHVYAKDPYSYVVGNKCKYASYLITPDGERVASDSWKGGKLMCVPLYAGQEKEDYENFADEVIIPARPEPKCIPDAAKFKYC